VKGKRLEGWEARKLKAESKKGKGRKREGGEARKQAGSKVKARTPGSGEAKS
jgi:hypothetical protein